jgi:hypothetical protein
MEHVAVEIHLQGCTGRSPCKISVIDGLITLQIDVIFFEERRIFATQPMLLIRELCALVLAIENRHKVAMHLEESSMISVQFAVSNGNLGRNFKLRVSLNSEKDLRKQQQPVDRRQSRQQRLKYCEIQKCRCLDVLHEILQKLLHSRPRHLTIAHLSS